MELAKIIESMPNLMLTGIYTFKSLIYQNAPTTDIDLAALEEGELMAWVAKKLEAAGIIFMDISAGSTPTGAAVAILVSVVAIPAFQMGVRLAGGTTAALLSTLEPLTSILFGILLLNESVTIYKLIGCCMILTGIILTIKQGSKQK